MKLIFLIDGRYRDGMNLFTVSPEDIVNEKMFIVSEDFGDDLVDSKRATLFTAKPVGEPEITLKDVKEMTVPELKAYAVKEEINLGEATRKDDIFAVIEKTFEV